MTSFIPCAKPWVNTNEIKITLFLLPNSGAVLVYVALKPDGNREGEELFMINIL